MPCPLVARAWPLTLIAILLSSAVSAQRPSKSGFGLKAGVQGATFRAAGMNYKPVPGGVLGVYAPIWVAPNLEIQTEVLASAQGSTTSLPEGERSTVRTLYALVPVTAKLFLDRTFNLQGGIQGGYLVMAMNNGEDVTDRFRPMDIGLNVGLGIDGRRGFDLTLRYYSGLSALLVDDVSTYPTNRTLQLTAGYRFHQFTQRRIRRH